MTQNNINQPAASSLVNNGLKISPDKKLGKIVHLNIRQEESLQATRLIKQENVPVIRRYSFDDNGGGYLGL